MNLKQISEKCVKMPHRFFEANYFVQSSTLRPGILLNSFVLFVITVRPRIIRRVCYVDISYLAYIIIKLFRPHFLRDPGRLTVSVLKYSCRYHNDHLLYTHVVHTLLYGSYRGARVTPIRSKKNACRSRRPCKSYFLSVSHQFQLTPASSSVVFIGARPVSMHSENISRSFQTISRNSSFE